jgi:tetratricopeptide (TPR) repeat protein
LYRAGELKAAEVECRAALRGLPDHAFAHGVLGHILLAQGRYPEAASAFDRYTVAGGTPDTDVYRGRGLARMRQGNYLGARDDYTQALELRPDAAVYSHRGWAYFFVDAWQPALRDFEEAIRLAPDRADAYAGRGLSRVLLGRYRESVEDAAEALRRGPKTPEMMHNVACIFALAVGKVAADSTANDRAAVAGHYRAEAIRVIRRTLAMVPSDQLRSFWRTKVCPDPALDPIRHSPEFRQLLAEYGDAKPAP